MAKHKHVIWLVGGGTGGHTMPLFALAEVLGRDDQIKLVFIGEQNGPEEKLAKTAHITFYGLPVAKLRRYMTVRTFFLNLRDLFRFVGLIMKSWQLISRQKPSVIVSKGGPVALPVALVGHWRGVPIITHESDAVIGLTNRFISRYADKVLTGFPAQFYPAALASKIIPIGIPLRNDFLQVKRRKHTHHRPMILVTGGSQGAVAINEAVASLLPELLKKYSVVHITGTYSFARYKAIKEMLPSDLEQYYVVMDFTPDIASFMHEASLVISRASSTIFELATLEKPMILIPLPSAANNHQYKNAEVFVSHNAAIMLVQDNLTLERLYETITSVLQDGATQKKLKEGTHYFACPDAAKKMADVVRQYLQ